MELTDEGVAGRIGEEEPAEKNRIQTPLNKKTMLSINTQVQHHETRQNLKYVHFLVLAVSVSGHTPSQVQTHKMFSYSDPEYVRKTFVTFHHAHLCRRLKTHRFIF